MATMKASYNDHNGELNKDMDKVNRSNRSSFDMSNSSMSSSDGSSSHGSSMSSEDPPISPIQPSPLINRPSIYKLGRCVDSTVPFKWEEAPGKPIIPCKSAQTMTIMTRDEDFPLQLPPCKALQGHHSHFLLENHKSFLELISEKHDMPESPFNRSSYTWSSMTRSHSQVTHTPQNSHMLHLPNTQKLRSLCKSLLKSTSWKQPLKLSAPLRRILNGKKIGSWQHRDAERLHHVSPLPSPYHQRCGNVDSFSVDDQPLEREPVTLNDRFFFDKESPKDLKLVAFMESLKRPGTFPLFDESPRDSRSLPIYDASQREDGLSSKDASRFLLDMEMEDQYEAANSCSSPCLESITLSGRWPTVTIVNLHERLQQDGHGGGKQDHGDGVDDLHCDFLSTVSSRGKPSQMIMNGDNESEYFIHSFRQGMSIDMHSLSEKPADITCERLSPPAAEVPWFLDFSPANEHADTKGTNKQVSLAKSLALIKLKNLMIRKVRWMVKRTRRGAKAGKHQASTMWSPTLATYLYNLQKDRSGKVCHLSSTEDDDDDDDHGGQLKINYYILPSTIRGRSVSLSEEEKPVMRNYTLPQIDQADKEAKSSQPTIRGSCFHGRDHIATCKGMCKVQKTIGVLAATMKLALEEKSKKLVRSLRKPSILYPDLQPGTSHIPATHK